MDIIELCKLGEGKTLEYKGNDDNLLSIIKAIISFSNTAGGIILIGVEDDGTIVGLDDPGEVQEKLANSISDNIKPQVLPDISVFSVEGKSVVLVQVDYAKGPFFLNDKGPEKGTYIRLGSSNRLASLEVVEELKRTAQYASFDAIPCDDVKESQLDQRKMLAVFSKNGEKLNTEHLLSLGLLTKKGRKIIATNGGVILFGLPEIRLKYFAYAEARCARFKGTSRAEFIDRISLEGGVLSAIEEVPKFIRRNTRMAGQFGEMKRKDIPEYSPEGIREALINAIVHANYEINGSRIFIAIYDDHLEIQNPGIMPPGMSIEQFKAGVSRIRNPVIARTFREMGLVEEWGSGYRRIKEACEEGGYPLPLWEEFGTALRVTFYPHPVFQDSSQLLGTKSAPSRHQVALATDMNLTTISILKYCYEPRSLQELMLHLGKKDRTKFTRSYIVPLLEKELLQRTLPDKPQSSNQKYLTSPLGSEQTRLLGSL